ncbi:MAG TPA: response regulator transcription factor [Streptosporangiaceae bacterium]
MTIRVLLAEDQTMVREALAALLGLEDDIEVVAQAASGEEALAYAGRVAPDIALLDIEMPGSGGGQRDAGPDRDGEGIRVAERLAADGFGGRVIILTTFDRPGYLSAAMSAGARGFLLKDAPVAELATAIRRVAAGDRVVDPGLAATALATGPSPLTARESDVLRAAREPVSVADLGALLHLSPGTVRNHLSAAIQKLGARNRADAVAIADRKGWL